MNFLRRAGSVARVVVLLGRGVVIRRKAAAGGIRAGGVCRPLRIDVILRLRFRCAARQQNEARAQQKQQVISSAEKTFGEIKLLKRAGAPEDEFAFVTPVASERELRTKLETLLGAEIISTIRVTDY